MKNYVHGRESRMSKLTRALGAAMLCLGLLSSASIIMANQDPVAPAQDPQKKEKKEKTTINGTVSAVTDSSVTIVDEQKAEHVLAITSDTKIMKGGKDATLADVKANDVVAIEATKGADNTWTALRISVS
jgi:hypothetical protein